MAAWLWARRERGLSEATRTDAWHHRGEVALGLHLWDEAIGAFEAVTAAEDKSVTGWCNLGIALAGAARYEASAAALERALALDEACLPAVNQMVYLHARRYAVLRDDESRAALMAWSDRSLALHPKQENILALRRAARAVEEEQEDDEVEWNVDRP